MDMFANLTERERGELCAKMASARRELGRLVVELGDVCLFTLRGDQDGRAEAAVWSVGARFQQTRDFIAEASVGLCECGA